MAVDESRGYYLTAAVNDFLAPGNVTVCNKGDSGREYCYISLITLSSLSIHYQTIFQNDVIHSSLTPHMT